MKAVLKALALIIVASMLAGFGYAHYRANNQYESIIIHERVHSGDTFDGIIEQYYNADNEPECWMEWRAVMRERNKMLFERADGSQRFLQPNDIICIEIHRKVKR